MNLATTLILNTNFKYFNLNELANFIFREFEQDIYQNPDVKQTISHVKNKEKLNGQT